MKKKITPELLKEAAKKFKRLSEYSFYIDEADNAPDAEADEKVAPTEPQDPSAEDNSIDFNNTPDASTPEVPPTNPPAPADVPEPITDPETDSVDVDVTQLVNGSKEAENAAKSASHKSSELLMKLNDLEQRVEKMSALGDKIDNLEKEVVKRNPTPVEKLEMRSLSSYPYNIKISDYWKDVEGYDTGENKKNEPKEYVLKKTDIDGKYGDIALKKTFDKDGYEEDEV